MLCCVRVAFCMALAWSALQTTVIVKVHLCQLIEQCCMTGNIVDGVVSCVFVCVDSV